MGVADSKAAGPAVSRAERMTSFNLADFPVPTGKEEHWRFAPLARFSPLFEPGHDGDAVVMDVSLAPEARAEVVPADDRRLGQVGRPGDRAAVAAWQAAGQAVVITLPAGARASEPTALTLKAVGPPGGVVAARPVAAEPGTAEPGMPKPGVIVPAAVKVLVVAEPGSQGVIVLDHAGSALVNESVELRVEAGAELTVVAVQDWSPGAVHASAHRAVIGRDAKLNHFVATFGGDAVRLTVDAFFSAPGGSVTLNGLYFADAAQYQEHRLFVDHGEPNCASRVTYKGALQGRGAHTAWVGDVLIRAEAPNTDTYELNRNLLLTQGARADSVPNLEIETGEIVGAGHASATGRFDDQQLFYLMARGIPEAEARRLVVRGFFAELIAKLGVPELEARLLASLERELSASEGPDSAGRGSPGHDSVGHDAAGHDSAVQDSPDLS